MSPDNESSNSGITEIVVDEVMVMATTDKQVLNKWTLDEPSVVK